MAKRTRRCSSRAICSFMRAPRVRTTSTRPILQVDENAALDRLLDTAAMQPPPAGSGRQSWPDYGTDAPPVHLPVEKDAVKLQVRFGLSPCGNCARDAAAAWAG